MSSMSILHSRVALICVLLYGRTCRQLLETLNSESKNGPKSGSRKWALFLGRGLGHAMFDLCRI